MGNFFIAVRGTGNHGCDRGVRNGGHVLGCQQPNCVDCIARDLVRRLKRNGTQDIKGQLIHWGSDQMAVPEVVEIDWPAGTDVTASAGYELHKRVQINPEESTPVIVTFQPSSVLDDLVTGIRTGQF